MMLSDFISKKAKKGQDTRFEGFNAILGNTEIGNNCFIGLGTVIGYPSKKNLLSFLGENNSKVSATNAFNIFELDKISKGAVIGDDCLIRGQTWIYEKTTLGYKVETGHNVIIREGVTIGNNTKIGTNSVIEGSTISPDKKIEIGNNVNIQTNVYISAPSIIGNDVFIGPHVTITNDRYPPSEIMRGIIIGNKAVIGANSTLISGVTIGHRSMVAAAAVVTNDVPDGWVVKGNPATKYIEIEEYLEKKSKYEKKFNKTNF